MLFGIQHIAKYILCSTEKETHKCLELLKYMASKFSFFGRTTPISYLLFSLENVSFRFHIAFNIESSPKIFIIHALKSITVFCDLVFLLHIAHNNHIAHLTTINTISTSDNVSVRMMIFAGEENTHPQIIEKHFKIVVILLKTTYSKFKQINSYLKSLKNALCCKTAAVFGKRSMHRFW